MKLVLFVVLVVPALGLAQEDVEQNARELYSEIISPFCPGRALKDCPSSPAEELRKEIRTDLERGRTKDEILNKLVERFDRSIRAVPQLAGVGHLAWYLPIAFFVLGLLLWLLRGRKNKGPTAPADEISSDYKERITAELSEKEPTDR